MKIAPVAHSTLARSVAERLLDLVVDGTVAPGEKMLSERALMDKLQVGRSTVREALSNLASYGIVEIRPGVGTFVLPNALELVPHARASLQAAKEGLSPVAVPTAALFR